MGGLCSAVEYVAKKEEALMRCAIASVCMDGCMY